jgi:GrpB-like predicted nucleotidyltransferase (UPF0157 family)
MGEAVGIGVHTTESAASITLAPYDPAWAERFAEFRQRLRAALGPLAMRIDHIGSTAVPGLPAEPVIDIQVSVRDVDAEEEYRPVIERLGLPMAGREASRRLFRPERPAGGADVYVCNHGSAGEYDHLLFPAYLRAHPERRRAYADLKRRLIAEYGGSQWVYSPAKGPFVRETIRVADRWARMLHWRP